MNKLFQIIILIIFLTPLLFTQTDENYKSNTDKDSVKIKSTQKNIEQMLARFDEFELYRSLNNYKMQIPLDEDTNTVWLRTSIIISEEGFSDNKFSPHFLAPLEQKYYRDSKFNLIRYALGMAQAGAVGYLAYKHIKKYGLFK